MLFLLQLLLQWYNYMFYLGLLVLPCTHKEGPRSPRPVGLFTLNHRVFRPFVGDCVPRPGPSSLVPDRRPSSRTVVPRPGPSSLVPDHHPSSFDPYWHIHSKRSVGCSGLVPYFTLVVPMFIYLSQYANGYMATVIAIDILCRELLNIRNKPIKASRFVK